MNPADNVRTFLETYCIQSKFPFAGQPLKLLDWQWNDIVRPIYGTLTTDGLRQYKRAGIWVPKKQGKSTLLSGLSLYHLLEYPGSEVYIIASDVEQAGIIFNEAANMAESHPVLNSRLWVRRNRNVIEDTKHFSKLKVLSSSKTGKAGFNANAIFFDELADWNPAVARDVWAQLKGSSAARPNSLHITISTAQFDKTTIGYEQYEYAKKVKKDPSLDPTFLPVIYEVPDDQDWKKPDNWWPALPSVPHTVPKSFYHDEFRACELTPTNEATFRTLYLNQWIGAGTQWIASNTWEKCRSEYKESDFYGQYVNTGFDIARCGDLTSWVHWGEKDGSLFMIPRAFIPEGIAEAKQRRDKVPYLKWHEKGLIEFTPGNTIDHEWIVKRFVEDSKLFSIASARMDNRFMELIRQDLERNHGIVIDDLPQTPQHMSPAIGQFERFVLNGKIRIPNNPLLDWCLGNCVPDRLGQDQLMIRKSKATGRIDIIIAAIIGLSAWMEMQQTGYADSSFLSFG